METKAVKQWLGLVFSNSGDTAISGDLVRSAFLRGLWMENLLSNSSEIHGAEGCGTSAGTAVMDDICQKGFLLGLFSDLDKILGENREEAFENVELPSDVKNALLGRENNFYFNLLKFMQKYGHGDCYENLEEMGVIIPEAKVHQTYDEAVLCTDWLLKNSLDVHVWALC